MADAITENVRYMDMTARCTKSTTVIASPSGNTEVVVATTPAFDSQLAIVSFCVIMCDLAYTIGTSGASCTVQIRRGTTTGGASLYSTGAQTGGHNTAGQLVADSATAVDTAPTSGVQYSVTLTVGSGAAASTVSAVCIVALAF